MSSVVRVAAVGAIVGIAVTLPTSKYIEAYLWGVSRVDWLMLPAIGGMLVLAAGLSALMPGLRAARATPESLLRTN